MERGSNLNVPEFWRGTLSHYAVCNNSPQCIELWVQLDTTGNNQEPRNMNQISMALVMEGGYCLLYLIFFILI
jgi:hypothetical protein